MLCLQRVREALPVLLHREREAVLVAAVLPTFLWFRCAVVLRLGDRKGRKGTFSLIIYWGKVSNLRD